jgi:hypothetical protein
MNKAERRTAALSPFAVEEPVLSAAEGMRLWGTRSGALRLRSGKKTAGTPLWVPPLSATFGIATVALTECLDVR